MMINRKLWALVEQYQTKMPKIFRTKELATERKRLMKNKYKNHTVKRVWLSLADRNPGE